MIKLVIPGRPVPKARPRLATQATMNVYTPKRTKEYEKLVGYTALDKAKGKMLEKDISLSIKLYFKDRTYGDLDNYAKAISDGLQGVVFGNDKQVAKLYVERYIDENERAEVEIREVG